MSKEQAGLHIAEIVGTLNASGFGVRLHPDPVAHRDFALRVQGEEPASPLDPFFVNLKPDATFFWIQVLNQKHEIVSACAARVVKAPAWRGGLRRLIERQRIFADRAEPLWSPRFECEPFDISGRIGYLGGGWTMKEWRDNGLIGMSVQLAMAHLYRRFGVRHIIGFVRPKHLELAMSESGYSFDEMYRTRAAYCAGTGFSENLSLVAISRERLAERYAKVPAYRLGEYRENAQLTLQFSRAA